MNPNFRLKYTDKLQSNSYIHPNGECRIWNGSLLGPLNKYGRIKCTISKGVYQNVLVHRLYYMIFNDITENELLQASSDYHISHLCHNTKCINPSHLSKETQAINNSRMSCICEGECLSHNPFPDCKLHLRQNLNPWYVNFCIVLVKILPAVAYFIENKTSKSIYACAISYTINEYKIFT